MREAFQYLWDAFKIYPWGVLVVGANEGQERADFYDLGVHHACFIEPLPDIFAQLQSNIASYPNFIAARAVCAETPGQVVKFHVMSNGDSSSLLALGKHKEIHPEITQIDTVEMVTSTADRVARESGMRFNALAIDTQGAELKVLFGASKLLENDLEAVYLEVFNEPLYVGSVTLDEVIAFFHEWGFKLVWLKIGPNLYGDALFVRNKPLPIPLVPWTFSGVDIAVGCKARQSSVSVWSKADDAQGALSGRRTGTYQFHTDCEDNPWWEVELTAITPVSEIAIFNRLDQGLMRAKSMCVMIRDADGAEHLVHDNAGRPFGGIDGRPVVIPCFQMPIVAVRIQLSEHTHLHLDTVEVYSTQSGT